MRTGSRQALTGRWGADIAKFGVQRFLLEAIRVRGDDTVDQLRNVFSKSAFDGRVFIVGGFVRDLIRSVEPADIDLLVLGDSNSGINAATFTARKLGIFMPGSNPVVYPRFGTALVRLTNGTKIEFVGVNASANESERALASDARRRDFTINTLMQNLATGEILDPTGIGIDDLKRGRLRTPINPELTFNDDPLRLIRAVRFALSFDLHTELSLIRTIRQKAHQIKEVSAERVRDELNHLLLLKNPGDGIRLLLITGLLKEILPELSVTVGMAQNKYHDRDVFRHLIATLNASPPRLRVRLAALFHDVGKASTRTETNGKVQFIGHAEAGAPVVRGLMRRLRYGSSDAQCVATIIAHHMDLKQGGADSTGLKDSQLRLFINRVGMDLEDTLDVIHADNVSHAVEHTMPDQVGRVRERIAEWDLEKYINPELPVDGHDVVDLGASGRRIGEILDRITRRYLEHDGIDRETAIQIARNMMSDSSSGDR